MTAIQILTFMEERVYYTGLCIVSCFAALFLLLLPSHFGEKRWSDARTDQTGIFPGETFFDLVLSAGEKVWVASSGGLLSGEDSSNTKLQPVPDAGGNYVYSVHNDTLGRIWAVGERGLLLFSFDGGTNWNAQNLGEFSLFDLELTSSLFGFAVGERGRIYRTRDGESWEDISLSEDLNLEDVELIDEKTAWIVGEEGSAFKSTDGGSTWHKESLPTVTSNFYSVEFLNKKEGWVVGMGGTLLHTTNGGQDWARVPTGTKATLYSIDFRDDLGVIVGQERTVLISHDRGLNWEAQSLPYKENLDLISVKLFGGKPLSPVVWVAGTRGYVQRLIIQNQSLQLAIQGE